MDRSGITLIRDTIADQRQAFARHYGVHPYFTRRSANVVRAYIDRFSELGDTVVDPFGGSGVTAIEALLMGRYAVQNDLNPFANFIAESVADTTLADCRSLQKAFGQVADTCRDRVLAIEKMVQSDILEVLRGLPLPENIRLPRNSDAERYHDLFTPRQLAGLAVIKQGVDVVKDARVRRLLLLAWSAAMAKLNRTFISAKGRAESRGGSSVFSIYRYKLAKAAVELPIWETFQGRFDNVVRAKQEVIQARDVFNATHGESQHVSSASNFRAFAVDAVRLVDKLGKESVDYIFTDPPYGGYIAYLDLSILWNHWLGFRVSGKARAAEAIVGGEMRLSDQHYKQKLGASVRACVDLLKPDRWLSVVFQHWDVSYFDAILTAASGSGVELRAAVTQEREVIWSMHKKKNREGMLAGEMILTFYKPFRPVLAKEVREARPALFGELLDETLQKCADRNEVTSQYLFNGIVLAAWGRRSMAELDVTRETFAEALRSRGWNYDAKRYVWRKGAGANQRDLFDE
jgi:16S rRNA G966 N2-methylase RsmD